MLKASHPACVRAALFALHAGGGYAAVHGARRQAPFWHASAGLAFPADARRIAAIDGPGGLIRSSGAVNAVSNFSAHGAAEPSGGVAPSVARPPQSAVPGYHALDAGLAGQAVPDVEPARAGRKLPHARIRGCAMAGMRQLAERHVFAGAKPSFQRLHD